ncbi:shTK domain protein [Teladorsagia circumcincta]|uniref:ShTK domain protein n=1 Tax=Teladorsagia circumcincta TaxID=45464 RepID=A0A2G9V574_TELCI|nr:shTK domain protein [Teladorsagia circumcincta]
MDRSRHSDPELVKAAVELCPQTCGYCCLTSAFLCNDKLRELNRPQIDSHEKLYVVNHGYHAHQFRGQCVKMWPGGAFFKKTVQKPAVFVIQSMPVIVFIFGNCVDTAPGCDLSGGIICNSKNLESFAREHCKKTCGYCSDSTVAPPGTGCGSNAK